MMGFNRGEGQRGAPNLAGEVGRDGTQHHNCVLSDFHGVLRMAVSLNTQEVLIESHSRQRELRR